jgi:hypothetical protein
MTATIHPLPPLPPEAAPDICVLIAARLHADGYGPEVLPRLLQGMDEPDWEPRIRAAMGVLEMSLR